MDHFTLANVVVVVGYIVHHLFAVLSELLRVHGDGGGGGSDGGCSCDG